MSSVTFTKEANQEDFVGKLDALLAAVNDGQHVTDKLEITSKNTPCYYLRCIAYPFMPDTFATFRTNNVSASLLEYCKANKAFANDEIIINKARKIVEELDKKTQNKYAALLANTVEAFEKFDYTVEEASPIEEGNDTDPLKTKADTLIPSDGEVNTNHVENTTEEKEETTIVQSDDTVDNETTQPKLVPYEDTESNNNNNNNNQVGSTNVTTETDVEVETV